MIYTSRFQNPELKSGNYTVVGIVRYLPRFKPSYKIAGNIIDIAPTKELFSVNDRELFTTPYMKHLDDVGADKISEQIQKFVEFGKDVVLCCYEDVRKVGEWCHRQLFAKWWFEKTGAIISELKDESPIKGEKAKSKPIEKNAGDDKPLIRIDYSVWKPREYLPYVGGDVYYSVDRSTGKLTRLFDKEARELISQGKADVLLNFDSIEKLRFVLPNDSAVKVYRVDKKGQEKEINFKDAIELASVGMFGILDIVTK